VGLRRRDEAGVRASLSLVYDLTVESKDPSELSIGQLSEVVRDFAVRRDWEQFHTPRNLVLALVGEVGELAAEFQWKSDLGEQMSLSQDAKDAVESEMADILSYLLRLADVLQVDLGSALERKIRTNEVRYPVDRAKGSSEKYTAYE